ncbi:uncharacterized protein LOC131046361 isoform X1 [Cryptomeria japonica]|uniref:uncharacterized protein LOC131046361 isoform X1 n=1 Tax=Cryptomeria japonica TaxID=3369 RepID=UPI0025ACF7D6|nr:uncharacterized protein LOC131046361 isoform X1 [Cryptomeria japonica]XP_057836079.1 uncharacterized protein LOC131046361 isoform X1 [Cryptomeria japonica]XP_057836080.1 uncharacterized protein LOC131046361 isoform X1 [Cryptomeria japonica]
MSRGYASLPTSHLPGSVPAVIDSDPRLLKSGEANLQIFPPTPNTGLSRPWGYQPTHSVDDAPGGVGAVGEGNAQPSNGWKGFFSITSYRPYFNVDTYDVVERIIHSLYPHRGDFVEKIAHNPDMYGPIWISTTLVFLAAVLGNYASYLSFEPSTTDTEWVYDINYVTLAAAIFYAYICLVPVGFYFLHQFLGINSSLVQTWCLFGYSLFIFIPASFLMLIPLEVFKWIIIALVGLESAFFVGHNMQSQIKAHSNNWTIPVFSSFVLQLCLALVIKLCFFA